MASAANCEKKKNPIPPPIIATQAAIFWNLDIAVSEHLVLLNLFNAEPDRIVSLSDVSCQSDHIITKVLSTILATKIKSIGHKLVMV